MTKEGFTVLRQAGLLAAGGFMFMSSLAAIGSHNTVTASPSEERPVESGSIQLAFITHLDANLPEQDVYLERIGGSGEVFRVTKGDNDMSAELFATAVETPHDPFNPDAIGPHPKGASLDMTLGDWLRHAGTGTYTCEGGVGKLETSFSGLVPNGVYTMWHVFTAMPPTTPYTGSLDLPLGARDGSESIFVAGPDGTADFDREFMPCLEMSDVWTAAMLALNYHSDGKTYRQIPARSASTRTCRSSSCCPAGTATADPRHAARLRARRVRWCSRRMWRRGKRRDDR